MRQKTEEIQDVYTQEEMHVIFMNSPFNYICTNSY